MIPHDYLLTGDYTLQAGRVVCHHGVPVFRIAMVDSAPISPTELDNVARWVCNAYNAESVK